MTDPAHIQLARSITGEIATAVASVSGEAIEGAIAAIVGANRIFVFGEGRSGLVLRMVAMRLVHLGRTVHIVGDATTPNITADDLLIAGSGSGATPVTVLIAGQAHRTGCRVLAVTATPGSALTAVADLALVLKTPAKGSRGSVGSVQPGGSLFEQSMLILFDALFLVMAGDSAAAQIANRHANLE
jgi:6-phospho-3-hexuloisomerase